MHEIEEYQISYRPEDKAGVVHLHLKYDQAAEIHVESPEEMSLILNILINEKPVYYDKQHGLLYTGYEKPGDNEG